MVIKKRTPDCQHGQKGIKRRVQMQSLKAAVDPLKLMSQWLPNWTGKRGTEPMPVQEVKA